MAKPYDGAVSASERLTRGKPLEGGSRALEDVLATLAKVNTINLAEIAEATERAKSVQERFREELEQGKPLTRAKPKKRKQHWKAKQKRYREYHKNVRKPRNAVAKAQLLKDGGWFALLELGWRKGGVPVEVTRDEWDEAVGAMLDYVPIVGRYDTKVGIRLDNVIVRDRDSDVVLFDGKEYEMKLRGYIL